MNSVLLNNIPINWKISVDYGFEKTDIKVESFSSDPKYKWDIPNVLIKNKGIDFFIAPLIEQINLELKSSSSYCWSIK